MTSGVLLICISLYLALVVVVCIWTYCCIAMHSELKLVKRSKLGNQTVIYSDCSVLLPEKCNFICPSRVFETIPLVYFFSIFKPSIQSMSIQSCNFYDVKGQPDFLWESLLGFFDNKGFFFISQWTIIKIINVSKYLVGISKKPQNQAILCNIVRY